MVSPANPPTMTPQRPALLALIGLAALAPVLAYALALDATGYVAAVSVVLIVASFFAMLTPSESNGTAH